MLCHVIMYKYMWIIYAILAAISASLVAIFGKIGLKDVDSTLATAVRSVVMALFLIATAGVLGKSKLLYSIDSKALVYIVLSGIAGALSWLFYFSALKSGPTAGVAALDRTSVVFVLLLSALFLAEAITWKTGLGALLITAGALLFVL